MSVLQDFNAHLIQGGHVDEPTLVVIVVHPLHSVWVALSTAECVAGHWLTGLVDVMLFMDTGGVTKVLMATMWMVCL